MDVREEEVKEQRERIEERPERKIMRDQSMEEGVRAGEGIRSCKGGRGGGGGVCEVCVSTLTRHAANTLPIFFF